MKLKKSFMFYLMASLLLVTGFIEVFASHNIYQNDAGIVMLSVALSSFLLAIHLEQEHRR
jgi:hypothetical protein